MPIFLKYYRYGPARHIGPQASSRRRLNSKLNEMGFCDSIADRCTDRVANTCIWPSLRLNDVGYDHTSTGHHRKTPETEFEATNQNNRKIAVSCVNMREPEIMIFRLQIRSTQRHRPSNSLARMPQTCPSTYTPLVCVTCFHPVEVCVSPRQPGGRLRLDSSNYYKGRFRPLQTQRSSNQEL